MASTYRRHAVVLGLLSAVGPFAIDMYLPALPRIAADLDTSTASAQMTLTVFFLTFGLCQLVYGPLSDVVGRKPPLFFGIAVFLAASIGCALSTTIDQLILFRALQGIGASAGMVIPRAIIRDLHTGVEATRLMSLVMLVFSVSPILAPLAGSAVIAPFGWQAVFVAVSLASLVALALLATLLPETRPPAARSRASLSDLLQGFATLLGDRRFLGLSFIGGLGMASFFAFLAGSSFIYIDHFGATPMQYSFAFAFNAIGFIGASQFAAHLGERFGMSRVVLGAVLAYAAFAALHLGMTAMGADSLRVMIPMLFLTFAFLGLVVPASMVLALEAHGPIAGLASALGGTLQMLTGGVVVGLVSLVSDGTPLPMVAVIAICALGAVLLSLATLRSRRGRPATSGA
ncbi:MFS transporter [Aureimonas sp. Leaf454]|uniref:multidrug effflux MFS transporter n=1 Tax=Aureimonas sp. Leaf454 TaxID=1736381 RepID=UPI000700AFDC|nr:multidrug effflux MFS transporter [Aureimonas sp. Leaf454]KQT46272.1 MFS transporter [Aureimonas sp. Leaf454]